MATLPDGSSHDTILKAVDFALKPFVGTTVTLSGWKTSPAGGVLSAIYAGGLMIQGPAYRVWINTTDLWMGLVRLAGDAGAALDAAFALVRQGEAPWEAVCG
ncbi:hypothetical protein BXT84_00925 [Sulfobacillus thermotolerans]|uniref:Uncharacterized protein n=1 Tax=Sulfobacillus thermotolerans TaxID=338644 RepID=A0ABM6RMZ1_9FIRM|nr:hypothetical protein BXT84_00925 [Sulfobacillus thermotolerans]